MTVAPATAPLALLAAGGTGGHVFPARALAAALLDRGWRVGWITDKRGTAFEDEPGRFEVFRIHAAGVAGRGFGAKLKAAADLARGFVQCRRIVHRHKPAVLVAFGGYVSVPPVVAAFARQVPIVLHEQNAVLGRANRLLAGRATAIAISFETVEKLPPEARDTVVVTGNPVRETVRAVRGQPYPPLGSAGPFELLVTGGSQGARVFAELVPNAVARLPERLRARLRITQQAREEDLGAVASHYGALGVDATVRRFFDDMPERLAAAHLLVCRSGASTVAENTVAGRPALLVPYPHAIDDHQTVNARALEAAGGAWTLPEKALSPDDLAERLAGLMEDPAALLAAAEAARLTGTPDAVERLADLVGRTARLRGGQHLPAEAPPASSDATLTRRAVA